MKINLLLTWAAELFLGPADPSLPSPLCCAQKVGLYGPHQPLWRSVSFRFIQLEGMRGGHRSYQEVFSYNYSPECP